MHADYGQSLLHYFRGYGVLDHIAFGYLLYIASANPQGRGSLLRPGLR